MAECHAAHPQALVVVYVVDRRMDAFSFVGVVRLWVVRLQ
jgi:hypothetical protein